MTIEQLFGHDASSVSEDHFEKVFGTLNEGPIEGAANECEVVASVAPAMTVEVRTGTFVTGGVFARVSAQDVNVIPVADALLPRIDRVVCRRDNATDTVTVYVLPGIPNAAPVPTALTRAGGVWEISLAQVYVAAAVVVINTADITDERHNYDVCGFTTGRGERGVEILDRDLAQVTWEDDALERTIYSHTIPAGALGATGGFRLTIGGIYWNNSGLARTLVFKFYLGGVAPLATNAVSIAFAADARTWKLDVWCLNVAAASQKWNASYVMSAATPVSFPVADASLFSTILGAGYVLSALDTADPLLLDVTIQHGAAHANLIIVKEMALLELIPPA